MPVTGTLGALTYAKETTKLPFGGWMFMITTPSSDTTTTLFDSTTQSFYNGGVLSVIGSFTNPALSNIGTVSITGTGNNAITISSVDGVTYSSGNNSVIYSGSAIGPYPNVFPYYTVTMGYTLAKNLSDGNLTFLFQYPRDGASPTANNQSRKYFNDIAFDSTNNMYIIGSDSLQQTPTTFSSTVHLYRYGSPNATTLYSQTYSPNTSGGFNLDGKIVINNNDEPIIAYESFNSYTRLVVAKIANTVVSGKQNPIWSTGIKSTANTSINLTDLKIDANANVFVGTTRSGGEIAKLDSNGNLLWSRGFGLSTTFGLPKIAIKNDDEIYAAGISSFNLVYTKMDANGNLQWRKQIDMGNSFNMTNPQIYYDSGYLYLNCVASNGTASYNFTTRVPDTGTIAGTYQFPDPSYGGNIVYSNLSISGSSNGINTWIAGNVGFSGAVPNFIPRTSNFSSLTQSSQKKFL